MHSQIRRIRRVQQAVHYALVPPVGHRVQILFLKIRYYCIGSVIVVVLYLMFQSVRQIGYVEYHLQWLWFKRHRKPISALLIIIFIHWKDNYLRAVISLDYPIKFVAPLCLLLHNFLVRFVLQRHCKLNVADIHSVIRDGVFVYLKAFYLHTRQLALLYRHSLCVRRSRAIWPQRLSAVSYLIFIFVFSAVKYVLYTKFAIGIRRLVLLPLLPLIRRLGRIV